MPTTLSPLIPPSLMHPAAKSAPGNPNPAPYNTLPLATPYLALTIEPHHAKTPALFLVLITLVLVPSLALTSYLQP